MVTIQQFMIRYVFPIFLFFLLAGTRAVYASSSCPQDDPCKDKPNSTEKVACYTDVVNKCATERESMSAQIVYLTTKIELTNAKIVSIKQKVSDLEKEITEISGKIDNLESSMTKISGLFVDRIVAGYKYKDYSYFSVFLGSSGFADLINRYKYVQTVQAHDRKLLFQMQNSKENFKEQKNIREQKKEEMAVLKKQLETEEANLDQQKRAKEVFLRVTKNSEAIYKQNLAAAQREAQEIQNAASILSAAGVAKRVNRGDTVGLMGNSGFSTGPHLHFAVYNLKEADLNRFSFDVGYENPVNYLSGRNLPFVSNSCDDVGSNTTRSIGSGSWAWPMDNPTITQCFGHTPFSAAYYRSGIHNGLDMFDTGNTLVKAAESGSAYTYRGGQAKGNGVFIFHDNGKMTLYWHLQ